MALTTRVDLLVPYVEKEDAKALGARWDKDRKVWYAPPGVDPATLGRWLPEGFTPPRAEESNAATEPEKGTALIDLLAQVREAIEQGLPDTIWVRAEVSELRGKNGHLYLSLTERNERGDVLAHAKGVVWQSRAVDISARFERATGEGLRTDIKILCLARVRFDVLYGLDLIIEDVDPSYTLGDLAAKLARIRERLRRDGLYDRNKGLPAPVEFVRVAVISPSTSAGLGDFRRETDRLQHAGLCDFIYYHATFQGAEAPSSIRTAVNEALAAHRRRPFDALVVIRGGGSVTDLAWLNDLELALLLCHSPVPVFTGIGHERDGTILDESAHRRFDTPSKVALHIASTIKDNALTALADLDRIRVQMERILARERTTLEAQADRIRAGVRAGIDRASSDQRNHVALIQTAASYQLREAYRAVKEGYEKVIAGAEDTLCDAGLGIARLSESISQRTQLHFGTQRSEVERLVQAVTLKAEAGLQAAGRDLDQLKAQAGRDATRLVTKAADGLECDLDAVAVGAGSLVEAARKEIEASTRMVVGLGPQATLRRGFAIARDEEGRPISSREEAVRLPSFQVQFHDGRVSVCPTMRVRGEPGDER